MYEHWSILAKPGKEKYRKRTSPGSFICPELDLDPYSGFLINQMYAVPREKLSNAPFPVMFKSLGCWKDTGNRAIPSIEGKDKILDGSYSSRTEAFRKCYEATRRRGYKVRQGMKRTAVCKCC